MVHTMTGKISGTISTKPTLTEDCGRILYSFDVEIPGDNGRVDTITVYIPQYFKRSNLWKGNSIYAEGQIRTEIRAIGNGKKNFLYFFAKKIIIGSDQEYQNFFEFTTTICTKPKSRTTTKGQEVTEFTVAYNSEQWTTAYITCIAWKENAALVKKLSVGTALKISGELQSRKYRKIVGTQTQEVTRKVMSINRLEII
jgi:primosomal replication protein N